MDGIVDKVISTNLKDLQNIKFDLNQTIRLIVNNKNCNYEFIINLLDFDDDILVFFPDFKNEDENKTGFTNFLDISSLKHNMIFFNDSKLYDYETMFDINNIGTSKEGYFDNIAEIFKILSKNISNNGKLNGVPYSNLYFYGNAISGFISILFSILIEKSTSIVDEPYLNLTYTEYGEHLKKEYLEKVNIEIGHANTFDIIDLIYKKNIIPNSYMIFDIKNEKYWEKQYKYFLNELNNFPTQYNESNNKINIRFEDKFNKSEPLSKYDTLNYIENILKIQKMNYLFNGKNLQMINKFQEIIECFYNDFNHKKITFEEFQRLKNNLLSTCAVCRVDIKNKGNNNNEISILNHDKNTWFENPQWFSDDNGKGVVIRSNGSHIELQFKCKNDGQLNFYLLGPDYKYDEKRIPIYVCYKKLKINDDIIFSNNLLTWHNLPFSHDMECKNGEIINLEIEFETLNNQFPYLKYLIYKMNNIENIEDIFSEFKDYVGFLNRINTPFNF